MISIFLNSRRRVGLLSGLLKSIKETVSDHSNVEVLVRIDNDDTESLSLAQLNLDLGFNITFITRDKPVNLHSSMNELARLSRGDFLFVLNDDTKLINKNWDLELSNVDFNKPYYISTEDNSVDKLVGKEYASFPILTRAAYNALGYFMSEKFVGLGADVHLWRVFNEAKMVQKSNIFVDHILHRTVQDVISPDDTAAHMRENTRMNFVDPWIIDIGEDVEKITSSL